MEKMCYLYSVFSATGAQIQVKSTQSPFLTDFISYNIVYYTVSIPYEPYKIHKDQKSILNVTTTAAILQILL